MKVLKDIFYTNSEHKEQKLDLYLPESNEFSVFVFFHGGGLECRKVEERGVVEDAEYIAKYLTDRNIAVVSADYRKYPYAQYPEFIRDGAAAVAWTFKNINNYGKCDKVFVGGSSAGAYISMMLCFDDKYLLQHYLKPTDIDGFFHDSGQPTVHFNVLREHGVESNKVVSDERAPIYYIDGAGEYPPMQFVVADNDMPNRFEQMQLLISTLKNSGYDTSKFPLKVMNGTHTFYMYENDENGDNIFAVLVYTFICEVLKSEKDR